LKQYAFFPRAIEYTDWNKTMLQVLTPSRSETEYKTTENWTQPANFLLCQPNVCSLQQIKSLFSLSLSFLLFAADVSRTYSSRLPEGSVFIHT